MSSIRKALYKQILEGRVVDIGDEAIKNLEENIISRYIPELELDALRPIKELDAKLATKQDIDELLDRAREAGD